MSMHTTLPVELYLPILEYIDDLSSLAALCAVDRGLLDLARKKLYKHVWVRPWEATPERKFDGLFRTLSQSTEIAALVERLDVIYYPLASPHDWPTTCNRALTNLVSLTHLTWTRDRSLTSDHLKTLAKLTKLVKLEINGHTLGSRDAWLLSNLRGMRDLKLHTPDRAMVNALPEILKRWDEEDGHTLESFEIITRDTKFIDDGFMIKLSLHLRNLKAFKLFGCGHVTPRGYFAVLRTAGANLEELGLEGVTHGDEEDQLDEDLYLERESSKTVGIRLLRLKRLFVTETVFLRLLLADDSRREQLYVERALARHGPFGFSLASIERKDRDLSQLGETSFLPERLEWLLLSRERNTLDYQRSIEASGRLTNIAELWPYGLERLWLSHLIVDFRDLAFIADRLSGLETLMIRLPPTKYPPQRIAKFLGKLPNLRVFHLQIAPETHSTSNDTLFSMEDIQLIARAAGPRLAQIGFFNRIFMVRRKKTLTAEVIEERARGWSRIDPPDPHAQALPMQVFAEQEDVQLEPWRKGTMSVPEIFQVWRV